MNSWKQFQEENKDRFLNELLDLLRIPSVSAKTEHKEDMLACAKAVEKSLQMRVPKQPKSMRLRATRLYMVN